MWQYFFIIECDSTTHSETSTDCTALASQSMILLAMTGLGQSSAIAAYQSQAKRMKRSHDENGSIQMNMYSLGVMDLDLSISPDGFGLRAFDDTKPVTRMLPGSSPCELRLMLPDDKLGKTCPEHRLGGRHTFRRRKSRRCADSGRKQSSTPYDAGLQMWNAFAETPRSGQTRRFVTEDRVAVAFVIHEYTRLWMLT